MKLGGKEFALKPKYSLREEKKISQLLSALGQKSLEWLQSPDAGDKEMEALDAQWKEVAGLIYAKIDGLPSVDEIGSDGLMELTQDFFRRGLGTKK